MISSGGRNFARWFQQLAPVTDSFCGEKGKGGLARGAAFSDFTDRRRRIVSDRTNA
jgi:hypothetical protein